MHTGRSDEVVAEVYRKTKSREFEAIDADTVAVVVNKNSRLGCVRVLGKTVHNTITGPGNICKRLLFCINSEKGEKGWIYGEPDVILYRQRRNVKGDKKEATS